MTRKEHYQPSSPDGWDGICGRCGHSYFQCKGNCTCLSCNLQRQVEATAGLVFEEDSIDRPNSEPTYTR